MALAHEQMQSYLCSGLFPTLGHEGCRAAQRLFLAPVIRASVLTSSVSTITQPFHRALGIIFSISPCSWYHLRNVAINISLSLYCSGIPEGSCKLVVTTGLVEASCFYLSCNSWTMQLVLFSMYSFPFCYPLWGLVACVRADMIRFCNYFCIYSTFW